MTDGLRAVGGRRSARPASLAVLIGLLALAAVAWSVTGIRTDARITGTSAGAGCGLLAVGVVRNTLKYPVLGGFGWGPGVPKLRRSVVELHLYRSDEGSLRRVASLSAPPRWNDATRHELHPRILADGRVVFATRGCPVDAPNCAESRSFELLPGGGYRPLGAWPEVTAAESAALQACTSYLTYEPPGTQVAIGPTGGPWRPVLAFRDGELSVIRAR